VYEHPYTCYHIPTKKYIVKLGRFVSAQQMIKCIAHWNMNDQWVYGPIRASESGLEFIDHTNSDIDF